MLMITSNDYISHMYVGLYKRLLVLSMIDLMYSVNAFGPYQLQHAKQSTLSPKRSIII